MALASGGGSYVPAWGPPASSAVTPAGSVHKSRGDNVGAVEDMKCVEDVTEGA